MKIFIPVILIIITSCSLMNSDHTDVYSITNDNNEEYRISVKQTHSNKDIENIVFVLDGNAGITDVYETILRYDKNILIVGIGYPETTRRDYDYTPIYIEQGEYGGADDFIYFINNNLKEFIDSKYSTENISIDKRIMIGHSLGGLCVLYMMYTDNQCFKNYIALSPAISWGNYAIKRTESIYCDSIINDSLTLLMAVGGDESDAFITDYRNFSNVLMSRENGLQLFVYYILNKEHFTMIQFALEQAFFRFSEIGIL